jgi:hypothetical protein
VTKVLTPDRHTVVLDLARSYNPAFYTDDVLSQIALIPQHAWDKTTAGGKVGNYDQTRAGGYSNPEEDRLVNATEYGSNSAVFFAYEDFTAKQLPYLWLPLGSALFVYRKNLAGITPWNPFTGTLNPEVWHYTKQGK